MRIASSLTYRVLCFLLLGPLHLAAQPTSPPGDIEVPFQLIKNQIVLDVTINKSGPYSVLLDTGVTPSGIDRAIARTLGLPLDTTNAQQASGAGTARVTIVPTTIIGLELGGHLFGDIEAVAGDLSLVAEKLGRPLHGILGYSFLKDLIVAIDYPNRTVTFLRDKPESTHAEVYKAPMESTPNDIMPLLRAFQVNGQPIPVSLDTGSSLNLELFPKAVALLGLEEAVAQSGEEGEVVGARGVMMVKEVQVDQMGIGPFLVQHPRVTISDREGMTGKRMGNLGNAFLQQFVLVLDYRGKEISLSR